MPSRAYGPEFYSLDELRAKVRFLTEQIDSALASTSDGLGASANMTSVRSMKMVREEILDEIDNRAGKPARRKFGYTLLNPVSGYGQGLPGRRRFWEF